MSLKAFHLVFVTLLTGLAFGSASWAFAWGHPASGAASLAAGLGVVFYGVYFLKKLKKIRYL